MNALNTLLPVFFMMGLGLISNQKQWITSQAKDAIKGMVFHLLFPILIFNILFTTSLPSGSIWIVLYMLLAFLICFGIGKLVTPWIGSKYPYAVPFLLTTCEGGNLALPLFMTIAAPQYQTYPVLFDMAGTVVVFMVIPVLVEKVKHGQVSWKETLCKILKNPFILAVIFGLLMNVCGLHLVLEKSSWLSLYNNLIDMATKPIVSIILFTIGYEMNITKETLVPILKLFSIRIILYLLIIVGFFLLFPYRMKEKAFCLAVLLYFMCPTSFALPMQLGPICTKKEQEFMSTFISIFMFITMIVYTCLVLFLV